MLSNLYGTNFFEDVKINFINGVLKINLIEYPIINSLVIVGEPSNKYKEGIKKIIELKEKDSFIENRLQRDVKKIKNIYGENGYNFAKVDTKIKKRTDNKIDLIFEIDRGEISKIKKIS